MDFPVETLSFPLCDLVDFDNEELKLDSGLESIFDDPNTDLSLFGLPNDVLLEPIADTSDSDSGISNHGDKLHPFLCDIEQGSVDLPDPIASTNDDLSHTVIVGDNVDSGSATTVSQTIFSKTKHPKTPEPLITASCDLPGVRSTVSSASSSTCPLLRSTSLVKTEPYSCTPIIPQIGVSNHAPAKIPRILSHGQSNEHRTAGPPMSSIRSLNVGRYYPASSGEREDRCTALVPAVVSLPVIDDFTFSSSFQVVSPSMESESFEKLVKKQERMIRNRQAACLSRLRKKEYLERLEHKLDQLRQENAHLRQENSEWRHRYDHLERCLGDIQAEFANLRRTQCTTALGGMGTLPGAVPSPPLSCSPSLPSPSLSSTPEQALAIAAKSQLTSSKAPLLRKHAAECIVLQKPVTANKTMGSSRVLGGVGLPRGVRKKVTTSLFAIVCLLLINFSITPLGQLGDSLTTTFGGVDNIRLISSDQKDNLVKTSFGGRTLLSTSLLRGSSDVVQSVKNRTDVVATVSDSHSTVNTTSKETPIEFCLPSVFFNPQREPVWIVFDEDDESVDSPLSETQKQSTHDQYVHTQDRSVSKSSLKRRLTRTNRLGRGQRRRLHKAYLLRPSQNEAEAEWNKEDISDSLYFLDQSALSNLTILLQNKPPSVHPVATETNATERSLGLCKLHVLISNSKDLRRRRKV